MQTRGSYDRVKCECFILPAVGCCQIICQYLGFISSCFKNNCGRCFVVTSRRENCCKHKGYDEERTVVTGSILKQEGKACRTRERRVEFKTAYPDVENATPGVILDLNRNIDRIQGALVKVKNTTANKAIHLKKKEAIKVGKDINDLEVKLTRLKKRLNSALYLARSEEMRDSNLNKNYKDAEWNQCGRKKLERGSFRPLLLDTLCREHAQAKQNVICYPDKKICPNKMKCYCYQCRRKEISRVVDFKKCKCKKRCLGRENKHERPCEEDYSDSKQNVTTLKICSCKKHKETKICERNKCRRKKKCKKCRCKENDVSDEESYHDEEEMFRPVLECRLRKSISDLTRIRRLRRMQCYHCNGLHKYDLPLYHRLYRPTYPPPYH